MIKIPNLYWEWFHHLNYRLSPLSILSHIDCLIHQFLVLMKEHFAPQVNSDGVTFCSPNLGCNGLKRLEEKKRKKKKATTTCYHYLFHNTATIKKGDDITTITFFAAKPPKKAIHAPPNSLIDSTMSPKVKTTKG